MILIGRTRLKPPGERLSTVNEGRNVKESGGGIGLAPWAQPAVTWALELEGRGHGLRGPDGLRPDLVQRPFFWPLLLL